MNMKKTFLILPLLGLLSFSANGQTPGGSLTCAGMLEQADAYVPSLCGSKSSESFDWSTILVPGPVLDIWTAEKPKMDWDAARKMCQRHVFSEEIDFSGPHNTIYETQFEVPCHAVETHFDEEEHRREVAEQIQRDVQAAKDLNILNDFLAGSAAK